MKKFIPMYDLSALTEQQKQDYVVALCEHLEIPPELNLVRLIWDDDGSTSRKQVAYVLKGGTDIIRANRKITTKSLTNVMLGGAVTFTCTGEDMNNRQEIAVGSKSIDGLHATRARIALATRAEKSKNPQLQKTATQYGNELSKLCLLLSDSSSSSLSRAAALLRSDLIDRPDLAIEACDLVLNSNKTNSQLNSKIKTIPNNSAIFYTIKSSALCDLEEYEMAIETISKAIAIRKLDKYILNVYSRSLEGAGRLDEALSAVKKVLEKWPTNIWAVHRLLSVLKASGDLEELGETLEYLKKLAPS